MNTMEWFYSRSFNGRIDRSSHATHEQLTTIDDETNMPDLSQRSESLVHTWVKVDDRIAHDYCVRH
jgi:hypothetical protein